MRDVIHIGSKIKEVVKEKGMTAEKFADALCCTRSNVYSIYNRKIIGYEQLITISEVLKFDFLSLCYDTKSNYSEYIIILESDKTKMEELSTDNSVKIIKIIDLEAIINDRKDTKI